jgi:hypothetical protein
LDENVSVDLEADSLGDLWQSDEFSNLINRVIDVPVAVTKVYVKCDLVVCQKRPITVGEQGERRASGRDQGTNPQKSDFPCTVTFESTYTNASFVCQ